MRFVRKFAVSVALGGSVMAMLTPVATASAATSSNYSATVFMPPSWPDFQTSDYTTGTQLIMPGTLLEGLVGYDQNFVIVPKVADHWTHNKNFTQWTFYLRHDAKWSNGQSVTAQDFYFAWMWLARPGQKGFPPVWASPVQFLVNGWSYVSGAVPASQVGLKVINDYTLQCTLSNPNPNFLEAFVGGQNGGQSLPLYPPLIKAHPTDWYLPQYFVGNGPYTLQSFTPNGTIVLTRNPKYVGNSHEDNVGNLQTIKILPAPSTPLEDYMSGATDLTGIGSPNDFVYASKSPQLRGQLGRGYSTKIQLLTWDKSIYPSAFDKVDVRKAIAYAINRFVIANKVQNGMSLPIGTVMSNKYDPYEKFNLPLNGDLNTAKKLLATAGYPNGKGLPTLYLYQASGAADTTLESIQAQLEQVGITSKILQIPEQILGEGNYDFANIKIKPGFVDSSWQAPGPGSYSTEFGVQFILPGSVRQEIGKPLSIMNSGGNNPLAVKAYGDPTNSKLGTKWSDWAPLIKDFNQINAWMEKNGNIKGLFMNNPLPGSPTNQQTWDKMVRKWKADKTDKDKHNDFVAAWQYLGGNGGNYGMDLSMIINKALLKDPELLKMNYDNTILGQLPVNQAQKLGGKIADEWEQMYWEIPLTNMFNTYLHRSWLTNVPANPYTWDNIINLQYLTAKPH